MVLGLRYGHEANPAMAALLAAGGLGMLLAVLRRVPDTRAKWEFRAPYEASDPPRW
jgi:hypothetical protein